jgi:hypothetical protein
MAWTKEECILARETLSSLEISFRNAEKFPNSDTKRELLDSFATAIQNISGKLDKNCAPAK